MNVNVKRAALRGWGAAAVLALLAMPALAQVRGVANGKIDPDGYDLPKIEAALPEYFRAPVDGRAKPAAIPDVFGPGAVLTVGNVYMKVTNFGHCGNFFTNLSNDPAGQWPGASGIEYLSTIRLSVGAVNPQATDPVAVRRVSYLFEWRPPTLDDVDKIYRAYDGIINGNRFIDDDARGDDADPLTGRARIDEDFLDGHDNDGDGLIDEDYGAVGQQMYSCVMRDDTPQAINATFNEKHVPLGVEVQQLAWAYSIPGFTDFDVIQYTVFNRSGHVLDSLTIGWLVDMDAGPSDQSNFFRDDFDLAGFPSGAFTRVVPANDRRLQDSTMRAARTPSDVSEDSALCPRIQIRVNAFSIADDNGDDNRTKGIPSFLLINHTVDPLGVAGPRRVGFSAFRAFTAGTPYNQGGNPIVDQQRFEFMVGTEPNNINEETGFIDAPPGDQKGDQVDWAAVGPWRNIPDGGSVQATVGFAVKDGEYLQTLNYLSDYARYQAGAMGGAELLAKYKPLDNAFGIEVAYEGIYEYRNWPLLTNGHGRETVVLLDRGSGCQFIQGPCELSPRQVCDNTDPPEWFDFDCDFCTGVYDSRQGRGLFHKTWNADAPPPNPDVNVGVSYNYSDNPDRLFAPAGDRSVLLAWDNLSEVSPDPKTGQWDFRGYKLWKVASWQRPVGSAGPSDDDWSLLGEFRYFEYRDAFTHQPLLRNWTVDVNGDTICPQVMVPNWYNAETGRREAKLLPICLNRGDLWDRQSGIILRPDTTLACEKGADHVSCRVDEGCILDPASGDCSLPANREARTHYPIGRYRYLDNEVKNGFLYFYSVTAFDSTGVGETKVELGGRRSAVESEGVVPQIATKAGKGVWVVPNPYRGFHNVSERPSAWDLTPNASDPTGTHIDFMGLPRGRWTIKIFTISGDLVADLKSDDAVNESIRGTVLDSNGNAHPGFNRQQDNPNDGQARWNLISRNGQDIVSGIYLFTVDSSQGTQRGRFVVIR